MKAYVLKTGRTFKGKIEVGEQTLYEGIMNILIDRSMCSENLKFGEVNSAYCTISVYDPSVSFAGKEITVYISAVIEGLDEWVKLGKFTAEKPIISDEMVEFTAFDCIKYKTDITYFPTLEGETAVSIVFEDICNQCGIPFVTIESELIINPAKLSGRKCKDALGQIAGFLGGNIVTDNEGRVAVRCFSECNYTVDENMMSEPTVGEAVFTLDGILCTVGDATLTSGASEGNILAFSNLLMTQEQLNAIYESYKNFSYYSASIENLVGNPFLEVGDVITVKKYDTDYKIPIMHLTVDFDGGVMNEINSYYKTPEEESGSKSVSEVFKDIEQIKTENELSYVFASTISNAMGLHYSKQKTEDGSYKIYGHDKETLADSTYIFTLTSEGFAFVDGENCWNNGNPNWAYGFTKDGNAIFRILNAHKISADLIEAGRITSVDGSTYFDLNAGQIGTTVTETDENGEEVVKYSYRQDAEGVNLETGLAITFEEFESNMTDEEKAEVKKEEDKYTGALAPIGKINAVLKKYDLWRKRLKGYQISTFDMLKGKLYYLNFSSNKAFFTRLFVDNEGNSQRDVTEFSVDGIKSNKRLKIDAPGIDLPWVVIPSGTDFDTLLTPNNYVSSVSAGDGTTSNYGNCPIVTNHAFLLEVLPTYATGSGIMQRLTTCSKGNSRKFERHYHSGSWGAWYCTYSDRNTVLWSGAYYMNADQTITLSEPISRQPSGIILSFSPYENNTAGDHNFNRFYISKYDVLTHGGSSGTFTMFRNLFSMIATKTLYISDQTIKGHANNVASGTQNGITYNGKNWVLREVVGV